VVAGSISQRLSLIGYTSRKSRALPGSASVALGGLLLMSVSFAPGPEWKFALVILGICIPQMAAAMFPVVVSEIAPPAQRGATLGIALAIGTCAGLIAPYVMGRLVQDAAVAADGFHHGFFVSGAVGLISGVIGILFIRPEVDLARLQPVSRLRTS
ncbi:MAG: hypothetical protein ACREB3_09750, partial [Burkholderiales bacterium]